MTMTPLFCLIRFQTSEPSGVLFTTTDDWGSDRLEIALSRGSYIYAFFSFSLHSQPSFFTLLLSPPSLSHPLCLFCSSSVTLCLLCLLCPLLFFCECYTVKKVNKTVLGGE
jgi:hypothetical protein